MTFAFGLAAASVFPAIMLGIFYKPMNSKGAMAAVVTGILFTGTCTIYLKFIEPGANTSGRWRFWISPEGIGNIRRLVNFYLAIGVYKMPGDCTENCTGTGRGHPLSQAGFQRDRSLIPAGTPPGMWRQSPLSSASRRS